RERTFATNSSRINPETATISLPILEKNQRLPAVIIVPPNMGPNPILKIFARGARFYHGVGRVGSVDAKSSFNNSLRFLNSSCGQPGAAMIYGSAHLST